MNNDYHQPVLVNEILAGLNVHKGGRYIDATVGDGGHTAQILKTGGMVLGLDRDPEAIERTKKRFETEIKEGRLILMRSNFDKLVSSVALRADPRYHFLDTLGQEPSLTSSSPLGQSETNVLFGSSSIVSKMKSSGQPVDTPLPDRREGKFANLANFDGAKLKDSGFDGILFDLGMSSGQLGESGRGFSFQRDEPLDMRMDPDLAVTAADLVNGLGRNELYELFIKLAQVERARAVAEQIVRIRADKPIKTTGELAGVVERVLPRRGKLHPATKVFMALRMAVNDELGSLERALPQTVELLRVGGRLAVISFHEGEDRIVKRFLRNMSFAPVSSSAKFARSPSPARTSHVVLGVASDGSSLTRKFANFANLAGAKLIEVNKKPIVPSKEEIEVNPRARSGKLRIGVRSKE